MGDERETRWRTWMVAAQAGETPAYEKLLAELIPYLRRFVQRRLLNAAAAEDVVQNVLISIHRARVTYRPERRFSPWLNAIARNAIIDQARQQARRSALRHLLRTYFNGSTQGVMETLLDLQGADLSPKDLEQLTEMIEAARKEGR